MDRAYGFEAAPEDAGVSVVTGRQTSRARTGQADQDSRAQGLLASVNHPESNMGSHWGKATCTMRGQGSWHCELLKQLMKPKPILHVVLPGNMTRNQAVSTLTKSWVQLLVGLTAFLCGVCMFSLFFPDTLVHLCSVCADG